MVDKDTVIDNKNEIQRSVNETVFSLSFSGKEKQDYQLTHKKDSEFK